MYCQRGPSTRVPYWDSIYRLKGLLAPPTCTRIVFVPTAHLPPFSLRRVSLAANAHGVYGGVYSGVYVETPNLLTLGCGMCIRPFVCFACTCAAGTLQMTKEFRKLGIEMAHENSDALHNYARDGTISWIHAARFLGDPTTGDHMPYEHLSAMCAEAHPGSYHSTMFYPSKVGAQAINNAMQSRLA
eukprot:201580-Pyramimonas_sp.AAC.1